MRYDVHLASQGTLYVLQVFVYLFFSDAEELGEIAGRVLPLFQQLGNSLAYCQSMLLSNLAGKTFSQCAKTLLSTAVTC